MAWLENRKRKDGHLSVRVVWRLGGSADGERQTETFSAGSDDQNVAR